MMKRESIFLLLLVMALAAACISAGALIEKRHVYQMPGKIVPAAVIIPLDGRTLRDEREREWLGMCLQALRRRLDSLAADSAGRRSYDSLARARPGLLDSLKIAEHYFSGEGLNH